jgi:hypothetical protein
MSPQIKKVISASRRVELAGYYSDQFIAFLEKRLPPESVHSIVIWTKTPGLILRNEKLLKCLDAYDQCFYHVTITGMGGTILEPNIPAAEETLNHLSLLISLLGRADHFILRFDPIVHVSLADGLLYTNFDLFRPIASKARRMGITRSVVSWMQIYPKVKSRMLNQSVIPVEISEKDWQKEASDLIQAAGQLKMRLNGCCVSGWPVSRCIDGEELTALHPSNEKADSGKAKGQRKLCGCTTSWDIGWYYPCPGGCLYCYANPKTGIHPEGENPQYAKDHLLSFL